MESPDFPSCVKSSDDCITREDALSIVEKIEHAIGIYLAIVVRLEDLAKDEKTTVSQIAEETLGRTGRSLYFNTEFTRRIVLVVLQTFVMQERSKLENPSEECASFTPVSDIIQHLEVLDSALGGFSNHSCQVARGVLLPSRKAVSKTRNSTTHG